MSLTVFLSEPDAGMTSSATSVFSDPRGLLPACCLNMPDTSTPLTRVTTSPALMSALAAGDRSIGAITTKPFPVSSASMPMPMNLPCCSASILQGFAVEIVRVRIKGRHHAANGSLDQPALIHRRHMRRAYQAEHLGRLIEVVRRRVGLVGIRHRDGRQAKGHQGHDTAEHAFAGKRKPSGRVCSLAWNEAATA
jgi:hypothetical protein